MSLAGRGPGVHATKDYYDMAALVAQYPDLHVTFNLTPVLMLQLEQLANGTKDIYWTMTEVPADELTADAEVFHHRPGSSTPTPRSSPGSPATRS